MALASAVSVEDRYRQCTALAICQVIIGSAVRPQYQCKPRIRTGRPGWYVVSANLRSKVVVRMRSQTYGPVGYPRVSMYPSTVGDEVIKLYLTVYLLRPALWALSTPLSTTFILRGARLGVGKSSFKFSVQQLHEYLRESLTFAHYLQGSSGCEMQSPNSKPKHLPVQCHAVISRWPPLSPGPVRRP